MDMDMDIIPYFKPINTSHNFDFTNIILDSEFKKLVYKQTEIAQNPHSMFYLGKLSTFEIFHDELKEYFKIKYNKKPTQTDNLAFILLLTYPIYMIERFQTLKDLKLAFNSETDESDFKDIGFAIDETMFSTCICNESLMYIHIFQNIHSGINIQLGSVCNTRYGLISKNNPNHKSNCKKIKEYKEQIKEKKEGLPEGFYKNDRKRKRDEKEIGKELKKLNKKNPGAYTSSLCIYCESIGIYNSKEKICICSKCVPGALKIDKLRINLYIKRLSKDCGYCEEEFISNKNTSLCKKCENIVKIKTCGMCKCEFCISKNKNDVFCDICEDNIIKCINTNCDIMVYKCNSKQQSGRCNDCHRRFINNLIIIKCKYCQDRFEVSENQKWRTCCSVCYKNNLESHKCTLCQETFKRLPHESWRKICSNCYSKR
jgi:hypothetical protein